MRQMKAFQRVTLAPGAQTRVELRIAAGSLALVASDGQRQVEPGMFDLWVDAGEGTELSGAFRVG